MTYRGLTNPPGHSSRLLKWRNEAISDPPTTTQQKPSKIFLFSSVLIFQLEISKRNFPLRHENSNN